MPFDQPAGRVDAADNAVVSDEDQWVGMLLPDPAATARLRGMREDIAAALPSVLRDVYARWRLEPELASMLGSDAQVARVAQLQEKHWLALLAGSFDDAQAARTLRMGEAHARHGLSSRWYVTGVGQVLEKLLAVLARRHRARPALTEDMSALLRTVFLDMEMALHAWHRREETDHIRDEVLTLADLIESDVSLAIGEIALQAERLADGAKQLAEVAGAVRGVAVTVNGAVRTTADSMEAMVVAARQLEASTDTIASQAARAAEATACSAREAGAASEAMQALTRAAEEIEGVVRVVRGVARQTRMLALNATIEATRAGDAGRGFAVVAAEVKGLANQTEEATSGVSARAEAIVTGVAGAATRVGGIGDRVRSVEEIAHEVCAATGEQRAATADIGRNITIAGEHTRDVADQVQHLLGRAEATETAANEFGDMSARLQSGLGELPRRLSTLLRSSAAGSRRRTRREPICLRFTLRVGGRTLEGFTGDLGPGGALLALSESGLAIGADGGLKLDGMEEVLAKVVGVSAIGLHMQFLRVSPGVRAAIETCLTRGRLQDPPHIARCQAAAAELSAAFEQAIATRRFTPQQVFDASYQPLPGSDPLQHVCAATEVCDALVPPITEPVKAADPAIVFCAPCDRHGYIATHNRDYSHPQRPGDRLWNTAHSRNRRIFNDRAGLLAARNTKPVLIQAYPRDMGGGRMIMLKEYDSPIIVQGRHWGAIRLAVKLPTA